MEVPRKMYRRFGVETYELSHEQFLNPGKLFDIMVSETNICKTGAFVGRLQGTSLTDDYVADVKDLVAGDRGFRHFKPLLIRRKPLWPEVGCYFINTEEEGSNRKEMRTLEKKRMIFKNTFLAMDFKQTPKCHLEEVLDSRGVGPCIDAFLEHLGRANTPILYAANIDPVKLGQAQRKEVNLNIADNVSMANMDSLIKYLGGGKHPGIVTPSLYIGNEASPFQCHREDMSFEAINMHVAGSPKIWFVVPPRYCNAFNNLLYKMGVNAEERSCSNLLLHKFFFFDPRVLISEIIPVYTIVQRPGDTVFLLPNAIHWGFNLGWNINEAVNCASKSYAYPGMLSPQRCQCNIIAENYFFFDITKILEKADVPEETIALYRQGKLLSITRELRILHPDCHPEMGVPGDCPVLQENLLGPNIDESQMGKFWQRCSQSQTTMPEYLGGFLEIHLDSEEEGDGEDENHEEDEVQDTPKGFHKCPRCEHNSRKYGIKARTNIALHAKSCHTSDFEEVMAEYDRIYGTKRFNSPSLTCPLCHKEVHGHTGTLNRHIQSCEKQQSAAAVKKRRKV